MEIEEIHIAIKSYKRAQRMTTHRLFPTGWVWVPKSQGDDYRTVFDRIVEIPDNEDGNLARKQNYILDHSPSKYTLILDDDITRVGYWEDGGRVWMEPDELLEVIWQGFILAEDLGTELWGINQNSDELVHYTYRPFSLLSPILGPFHGHLSPSVRYDESVMGKDDYDFWLQTIQKVRKTLRMNKYHYKHDSGTMPGGFVSMRTNLVEDQSIDRMIEKWGSNIFRMGGAAGGKSATGKNKLNSFVRVPIPGC